jgi:hypothetical protein
MATTPAPTPAKLTIRTTALVSAVWVGVMSFAFALAYLMPGQLFVLLALALVLGAGLTLAVLWFTLRLAEIVVGGKDGDVVVVDGEGPADGASQP